MKITSALRSTYDYLRRNAHYIAPRNWRAASEVIRRKISPTGVFVSEREMGGASLLPQRTLQLVIERFRPKTVLDLGCGTGQSLSYFLSSGIDAWGVEGSRMARSRSANRNRILIRDLRRPLNFQKSFDLVWCYEVAEHIDPAFVEDFVSTLTSYAPVVVMTAAPPGQGGEGHINEQPKQYWIDRVARRGFAFDPIATQELVETGESYSSNAMVFVRTPVSIRR